MLYELMGCFGCKILQINHEHTAFAVYLLQSMILNGVNSVYFHLVYHSHMPFTNCFFYFER